SGTRPPRARGSATAHQQPAALAERPRLTLPRGSSRGFLFFSRGLHSAEQWAILETATTPSEVPMTDIINLTSRSVQFQRADGTFADPLPLPVFLPAFAAGVIIALLRVSPTVALGLTTAPENPA